MTMTNRVIQCQTKIQRLLDKDCQIDNEKFLTPLETQESVLKVRCLPREWVKNTVLRWSTTGFDPPPHAVATMMDLVRKMSQNEEEFSKLNEEGFFVKLLGFAKKSDSSVKLSYIKLLSTFIEHKSGIEFIMTSGFWEDTLNLNCVDCLVTFLEAIVDDYDNFCNDVVKKIMKPLEDYLKASDDDIICISEEPESILLIEKVLVRILEGIYFDKKNFGLLFVFLKNLDQDLIKSKLLDFHCTNIYFVMQLLELYAKVIINVVTTREVVISINRIKKEFLSKISKDNFENVISFVKFGLLYWTIMESTFHYSSESVLSRLVSLCIVVHYYLVVKYCLPRTELEELWNSDELRDAFVTRLITMLGDNMRLHFFWRDRLIDHSDLFKICISCIDHIKEYKKCLSKSQAVVYFQALFYVIKDINCGIKTHIELFKQNSYLLKLLEMIYVFIDEFDITLSDGLEAVDVLDASFEFLLLTDWSQEIVVAVLQLIKIAIIKYMSPILVFVSETTDSGLSSLGTFLTKKIEGSPEVKKAALDIVYTLAFHAKGKFPSLQKVLMDSELPTLVVKMSACDGESFVRATAIKCLQEMIQVEEIWNNALKSEDLSQKMRDILLNETEGIVRVEAATFMCVAYENQQLPKETLDKVYETMIYSSTTDLHWEVKVRALDFWDKVIKNHLQNQGMIDGSFPNVTFSKEHRKIVTLTDSEIRKRLLKVLSQLSAIGCLGVLMSAIKDDCDMEVSKTAVKITQRLVDLFKKYNVRSDSSAPTSPTPTENGTISMSSGISVDESMDSPASSSNNHQELNEEIIDQIVNSKDVSLLKNVYTLSDYGSVSNYDIQVRKIVTPNEFLQFTQQDLNNIITEKKKWLNGIEDLGSLLDDMLKTYDDDVNNMDCY